METDSKGKVPGSCLVVAEKGRSQGKSVKQITCDSKKRVPVKLDRKEVPDAGGPDNQMASREIRGNACSVQLKHAKLSAPSYGRKSTKEKKDHARRRPAWGKRLPLTEKNFKKERLS